MTLEFIDRLSDIFRYILRNDTDRFVPLLEEIRFVEAFCHVMEVRSEVPDLVVWERYCAHIGFPDHMIHRILAQQTVMFSGSLYSPEHKQRFSTDHSEAKLERDPENQHRFNLKIDGVSVFQWFRQKAKELLVKMGLKSNKDNFYKKRTL